MKRPKLAIVIKEASLIFMVYAAMLLGMYVMQNKLIYLPGDENAFAGDHRPLQTFTYQTKTGLTLRGLWKPPAENQPVIVHFHGNGGSVAGRIPRAEILMRYGYGIALVEYRGYGGNPGLPNEANLMDDARAAIRALHEKGIPYEEMVLYGESLGTGVAIKMAAEYPHVKALILESPYMSLAEVGAMHFWYVPVQLLLHDRFESDRIIGQAKMPVLVLHGTKDAVIPFSHGKSLFSLVSNPKKQFVAINGGEHHNLYNFEADKAVNAFLQTLE